MRKILFLFLAISFASCNSLRYNENFIDINGSYIKPDYSKHTIYIVFSTLGCHDCHKKLNEYVVNNQLYCNDSIEFIGIIGIEKKNSLITRKIHFSYFKNYYPEIKRVYFCEEDGERNILCFYKRIPNYETPAIIYVNNKRMKFIGIREVFDPKSTRLIINNGLKDSILF